jgi:archaellum component FlaC
MAEVNNPIKTGDLFQDDGTIDKLIADLERLRDKYVKSIDEIQKKANTLDQSLRKLSGTTDEQKRAAQEAAVEADRLSRSYKEMKKEAAALESEIVALRRQKAELTSATQEETKATQAEAKTTQELNEIVEGILGTRAEVIKQLAAEQAALAKLRQQKANLAKVEKDGMLTAEEAATRRERIIRAEQEHKTASAQLQQSLNAETKQMQAAGGSMNEMSQLLGRLRMAYRDMTAAERNSPLGEATRKNIGLLDSEMKKLDASIGNYQRNVGNYGGAFTPLQYQVQQVARELPSLTMSLRQFFLAISNNLPMLIDEVHRARIANEALLASGQKGVPVWKQLLKSIVSWQTALVVGITLVTAYGKEIGNFFSQLFGGTPKMRTATQMFGDVNKAVSENSKTLADNLLRYKELQREWKAMKGGADEQRKWIKENQSEFTKLGISIQDADDAQSAFVENSPKVIEALKQQAKAAAARELAIEQYQKAIKERNNAETSREKARNARETQEFGAGGYVASAAQMSSSRTGMTVADYAEQRARVFENEAKQADKLAKSYESVADAYFELEQNYKTAANDGLVAAGLDTATGAKAEEKLRKEEERKRKAEEAAARRKQTWADKEARAAERQEKYSFDAAKKSEQLQIDAMQEGYAKRRATIEFNAKWEEAELERRYNKIEGFAEGDADLWKDYAYAVLANEKAKNDALIELDNQYAIETRQLTQETLQNRLAAVQEGSAEYIRIQREMLENARQIELLENKSRPKEQRQDEDTINAKYRFQSSQQGLQSGISGIDTEFAVRNSEIEALKATEREKTVLRLQAEKERWEKVLAMMRQYGGVVSDADVAIVKNALAETNNELEKAKRPRDFWDVVGINLDDEKKQAISESVSFALEQMTAILDAEIEMAQQAVDAANERVTAAQSALDAEMQAKANGLAYSQTEAEKRLAMEKQNQAKAIAEQKKAQKQKAQIETLQQISSLVTASAAIWGALVLPWLAIPAIAIMWATFGAAKIKASQLAKSSNGTEQYGDGTYEFIDGGSHQSGNDVPLGINPKTGKERRVEGGEMFAVVNKAGVRKYRSELPAIINSLNRGEFDRTYIRAAFAAPPTPVVVNAMGDNRKMADDIAAIRRLSERQVYTDAKGRTVIRYKNLTRKIN